MPVGVKQLTQCSARNVNTSLEWVAAPKPLVQVAAAVHVVHAQLRPKQMLPVAQLDHQDLLANLVSPEKMGSPGKMDSQGMWVKLEVQPEKENASNALSVQLVLLDKMDRLDLLAHLARMASRVN